MNRPVAPENLFLRLSDALRGRNLSIPLRITVLCLGMVTLTLLLYAWVIGSQLRQTSQQQAELVGQTLITQTGATATNLLVANDILSLNVLLGHWLRTLPSTAPTTASSPKPAAGRPSQATACSPRPSAFRKCWLANCASAWICSSFASR